MNTKKFSEAMSEVDDKYYVEAANYQPKRKNQTWVKWGSIAACLCLAAVFATSIWTGSNHGNDHTDQPTPMPVPGGYYLMTIVQIVPGSHDSYDAERYDAVLWLKKDMISYFGRDLTPPYIPDGLKADSQNGTSTVFLKKDGAIVRDTFYWNYYDDSDSVLRKGFTLAASKIELPNDCIYLWDENDLIASYFGDVSVMLGMLPVQYGSYDADTHEPSGYYEHTDSETGEMIGMYNKYVAEFEFDDVKYQLISERMEYSDFIEIIKSIIISDGNATTKQQLTIPDRGTPPHSDEMSETNIINDTESDDMASPMPTMEP